MGLLELLTIIFVVLKLTGVIAWSWWLVLLPTIISVSVYTVIWIIAAVFNISTFRRINKTFKDDDFFK